MNNRCFDSHYRNCQWRRVDGLPEDDGATSTTAWLSNSTGIHKGEAAKLVGLSRVTTSHAEATSVAWATGALPTDKAAVIMKAIDGLGGSTDLDNAALFCHFHHLLLHEGEWTARMADDGVVEVIPPARVDPRQQPRRHSRFTTQQPRAA